MNGVRRRGSLRGETRRENRRRTPPSTDSPFSDHPWFDDPWDRPVSSPVEELAIWRPPHRWRSVLRGAAAVLTVVVLLAGAGGWWLATQLNPGDTSEAPVNFTVLDGDTLDTVSRRLEDQGIIVNNSVFRWYVGRQGGIELTSGYYSLRPRDSARNIYKTLSTPPSETYFNVTFPEGYTVAQIAERLDEASPAISAADVIGEQGSGRIVSAYLPPGTASLEGLLFPDTYQMSGGDTAAMALQRMASLMERIGRQEGLDVAPSTVGYSPYQVLTIASMIEREARLDADRALIARVIYNRLALKMNLEIDAAVLYGGAPGQDFAQLKPIDGPYNLYLRNGLPPTPIANPGRASIRAALAPAADPASSDPVCAKVPPGQKCRYLYYVIKDRQGGHAFAATYEEHLVNVEAARAAGLL